LEGETPPNLNVLFPVVFENEASTPLEKGHSGKKQTKGRPDLICELDL
jgi:hypothetical protein